MNKIHVSSGVANQAKLAAQTVRKSLKYLIDEGFAEASYGDEQSLDILRANIIVLPREFREIEIE
jgi:hypothetical protein